jgi:hypothetical protein
MTRLLSYLGHSFPKIRKTAAEQFYLQLEINEGFIDGSKVEEVKDILLTTQWYVFCRYTIFPFLEIVVFYFLLLLY